MLHGALHRFIALALLHLNSDTNLGYCPRAAQSLTLTRARCARASSDYATQNATHFAGTL